MKSLFFSVILCLVDFGTSYAAPAPPLENVLQRAETVVLAKVASVSGDAVTFHFTEVLRGRAAAEIVLSASGAPYEVRSPGSEFFLISQGDARFGPPQARFGRPMLG